MIIVTMHMKKLPSLFLSTGRGFGFTGIAINDHMLESKFNYNCFTLPGRDRALSDR